MNSSILNIDVSCFENCKGTTPRNVRLLSWLTSDQYRSRVEQIRSLQDEDLQKTIKASLPAITPSGVFDYRSEKDLIEHSGFLAFDIDFKDNQHIINFNDLKSQISHIASVAYCGLSVRGNGYWGLVPIPKSTPDVHKLRFSALAKDFKEFGIVLDVSGKDICRLRIYSWDDNAYYNHSAKIYTKLLQSQQNVYRRPKFSDNREKVEAIISQIKENRIDLTQDYKEGWLKIASAFANEFGESGRGFFHAVSQFHPEYSISKTDRMFDQCLKHDYDKVTIASFFHIAERYGIKMKPEQMVVQSVPSTHYASPSTKTNLTSDWREGMRLLSKGDRRVIKKGIWDEDIAELERFFKVIDLPKEPIRLNQFSLIEDASFFIESHMSVVKAQNGNKRYEQDLNRLKELKGLLSLN